MKRLKTSYLTLFMSLLVFHIAFDEPQHAKTNKTSTTLINADQTKTGQKTWLVPIVSLMVLSCSGPNTLALLNKQLSNNSFSLFFSCHAAPFLDKCFFTRQTHVTDLEFEDYLPHHNKKQTGSNPAE